MKTVNLLGGEYKVNPINLDVGETYKNFKGHYRTILSMYHENTKGMMVKYEDGTGLPRICKEDSFRQWIKKCYY